jgi:MerR family transcriptional regulator, copper efflux regulator
MVLRVFPNPRRPAGQAGDADAFQTLRYYERQGLLADPSRRPSGHRGYEPETVQRIRFIKRAQELGFTLAEIGELLVLREDAGRRPDGRARACQCERTAMECPIIEALEHAS